MANVETFEGIYLDLSKESGKCRFAENGLGWKPASGGDTFTLEREQIAVAQWSKSSKNMEIRIIQRNSSICQLDGFAPEDYDRINRLFKNWYGVAVEQKEHSMRGWNWGKGEFGKVELQFSVRNQPAFELPYSEISNTNLAGKNEVAVEFRLDGDEGAQPGLGGARKKGTKAGAGKDQLVEMRFYVPGVTTKKAEGSDAGSDVEAAEEEQNAASLFYDMLMQKADIGDVAGDTFATFLDVLHLTPRGRFDIDMYESSFRLRGKTYDYKIPYDHIKKFMVFPKPDDMHYLVAIGLDPPLRQGQTRYPFLVTQFKRDEEVTIELNMTPEMLESDRYKDKLKEKYEQPLHEVVVQVFRGLSGKKVTRPAAGFMSHHGQYGIKCSIKASEGFLYCLEKAFMFVPKPASYISFEQIVSITFSRLGGGNSAARTFDLTVAMKEGGDNQFSNINREEQQSLENFFRTKNIRVKNEMDEDGSALLAAALNDPDMASSDDEVVAARIDRGSADEDDESVDEDFKTDDESDVAEEYDENHDSSGSDSEEEGGSDNELPERPKKKAKTG